MDGAPNQIAYPFGNLWILFYDLFSDLKERLLESFAGRRRNLAEWNPGTINFEQLKEGLKTAGTFDEVFHLVREYTTVRPELR